MYSFHEFYKVIEPKQFFHQVNKIWLRYVYFYKRKYSVKVHIDGSLVKKYTNLDKLSGLSLYIFLPFWGNERRQKPNIPHLNLWPFGSALDSVVVIFFKN